jgi:hypothetical protein
MTPGKSSYGCIVKIATCFSGSVFTIVLREFAVHGRGCLQQANSFFLISRELFPWGLRPALNWLGNSVM